MLMQPEGMEHGSHTTQEIEREKEERDIDGVPLLESEPIDFSRTGGGLSVPVTEEVEGTNLDGEPMEVMQRLMCVLYKVRVKANIHSYGRLYQMVNIHTCVYI